jgi:tRNA pseudouridine38-40 synthase
MRTAAASLLGTHDFSAFCNERSTSDKDPICTLHSINISYIEDGRILFRVVGNRFLYKMVRNLIGTLTYVGQGKIKAEEIPSILSSQKRTLAGITAPAHGLHLMQVFYNQSEGLL